MTTTPSNPLLRRRTLTASPLLLIPLLLTACATAAGTSGSGGAASATSTHPSAASGSASASTGAAAGAGLYDKYPTGAKFCALISLADVSAAMQREHPYTAVKVTQSPAECTYINSSPGSIVTVAWNPAGAGLIDDYLAASPKMKAAAIDIGGHPGRALNSGVQVVVGDAAIDVFGIGNPNLAREAALAATVLKKVQ